MNHYEHTRTCDGLGVPAFGRCRVCVKLAGLALAHILLLVGEPLVGLGLGVWVRVWGLGGQLDSPLTGEEKEGPWASGAGAPLV